MFNLDTELKNELFKTKPDSLYIKTMEKIKETGSLTLEEFSNTGRFTNVGSFLKDNTDATLHHNCTDVVQYIGGIYVQALKDNTFFADVCGYKVVSKSLDEIEVILWDIFLDNLFNNQK